MKLFFPLIRASRPTFIATRAATIVLLLTVQLAPANEAASQLAGVALPAGASRIVDAKTIADSVAPLKTLATNLETPVQVGASEVLAWGGTGFNRNSGTNVITAVQAALQIAGFQTIKLGEPQAAQGKTISFFLTANTTQKKALLGYWLESDSLLMLILGEAVNQAAPTPTNPLDVKQSGNLPPQPAESTLPRPQATAPAATTTPVFPKLTAKPNQATGAVLNMQGKPLATAQIRFWRLTPQGAIIEYVARTNAQGIYSLTLPPASDYRIDNAVALVTYGVQRYYLPLRPANGDGSFFDRDPIDIRKGYVKNFVLPISGKIADELDPKDPLSYYGGAIEFRANIPVHVEGDPAMSAGATMPNAVPDGTVVELFLAPQGPLLDGTTGRALSYKFQIRNNGRNAFSTTLKDIPIGVYTAAARLTYPDGTSRQCALAARLVTVNGMSNTFITNAENPIFFAPRWETWPEGNGGDPDWWLLIKRSSRGGAGAVWLEPGD